MCDYFSWYDNKYAKLFGISQEDVDLVLLEQAKAFGPLAQGKSPEDMARFDEVMEHFLAGHGRTLYFKMAELLSSCAGARRRVIRSDLVSTLPPL